MNATNLPLVIESDQLEEVLSSPNIIVIDLCKPETYLQSHVPGAVHLDYQQIVSAQPPVMGLVPGTDQLNAVLSNCGVTQDSHIIAYDDEGGGRAARLLYTLDVIGHKNYSLLNGGLHAWAGEGHPIESGAVKATPSQYLADFQQGPVATKQFITEHLDDNSVQLVDARSQAEFTGNKKFAEKGGHIPGAVNIDWLELMDQHKHLRLKSKEELGQLLETHNISPDKTTVVYCQTHHRSALSYIAFKHLGFSDVKGYPGSWSEWGNSADTPVEN